MESTLRQLNISQLPGAFEDYPTPELQQIDSDNWNCGMDVKAGFRIAYDPVYKNSCVEFFVSFENGFYYNLEFNCIGTILGAYEKGREDRIPLEKDLLGSIQTIPSLGRGRIRIEDRETLWTLDVKIPITIFKYSDPESFHNKKAFGNFYKCGDEQVVPHYLSWARITTENPGFHRPEYFGEVKFA
ncbi:MAG TPA: hypothetical protein ENI20_09220 [Bacteroides sp.]|nr:hypothetical protein [Bacteroides sp.]